MSILMFRDLYVSPKAEKKIRRIKWELTHGVGTLQVYLLTMPTNTKNSLDIVNAVYLKQPHYKKEQIKVVGIAMSYEEALELLQEIVSEVYEATQKVDIKEYLYSKQGNWQV